jgi:hypothetical protein
VEFSDQLGYYQLLKKDHLPRNKSHHVSLLNSLHNK